ncbi:Calponin family repeat [Popillia japonica]|uniref:Calponin family repeat n=1 Tax=Popillia japonica TaxID=7064 RepID=A0AAW1NE72_POPJA
MAKRNKEVEAEILTWIFACIGEPVPKGEFEDILRDGVVLCNLMNKLSPGSVKKIQSKGTNFQLMENIQRFQAAAKKYGLPENFQLMENIQRFQAAAKKYGLPEEEIFQTADLFERRNIAQVAISLYSLGRITQKHPEWNGPQLGPKMADKNERTFSEDQLRSSEGLLNLQMGYNKGASQSGHGGFAHYVTTCQIKKPDFVNCSTNAVQKLFDEIPSGIPEIGLDPLDPLKVPIIKILQGAGPVNVNASLTDVTVLGFGNTHIRLNNVDSKTYDFYTELSLPRLRIDGNYKLLGRILVIPLKGAGTCWFDAKNLDITVRNIVNLEEHDGFHFFRIVGIKVNFSIGGLSLYMSNLFDGIKALEESTNRYLNENWQVLADSLNPILSKTIESIMFDILRKVFDNIPADFFISDLV